MLPDHRWLAALWKPLLWLPSADCVVAVQTNVFHTQGAVKLSLAATFTACLHGTWLKEITRTSARHTLCAHSAFTPLGSGYGWKGKKARLKFCGRPIERLELLVIFSTLFPLRYQKNSFTWFSSSEIWLSLNSGRFGMRRHSSVAMTGWYFSLGLCLMLH